jgi:hypothetical protein
VRLVICSGSRAVQRVFDLCQASEALPFVPTSLKSEEPRDPVSPATGDAGSGGALSSRPQRRRPSTPTLRRPAPCQPLAPGAEVNGTFRKFPGRPS